MYKEHRASCLHWLKNKFSLDESEDREIFQQAVVVLYDNVMRHKVNNEQSSLNTYLYAIAKFKAYEIDRYRKKWANKEVIPSLIDQVLEEKEDKLEFEKKLEKVTVALSELGDPCKTLLKLFYFQELNKYEEYYPSHGSQKRGYNKKCKV